MKIAKHAVVAIHYTLKDNSGNVLDSSAGRDPLWYLHGEGNLIPGMEEGLEGREQGNKFELKIAHNSRLGCFHLFVTVCFGVESPRYCGRRLTVE